MLTTDFSIPLDPTNVNPPAPQGESPNLSKFTTRFYGLLLSDYFLRYKERSLKPDGSFYGSNKRYYDILGCTHRTIIRAKKSLAQQGKIRFLTHQGRGRATSYWLLDKIKKRTVERTIRPDNVPYLVAQKVRDCAKQFGRAYALKFFAEQGYSRTEIEQVLDAG